MPDREIELAGSISRVEERLAATQSALDEFRRHSDRRLNMLADSVERIANEVRTELREVTAKEVARAERTAQMRADIESLQRRAAELDARRWQITLGVVMTVLGAVATAIMTLLHLTRS